MIIIKRNMNTSIPYCAVDHYSKKNAQYWYVIMIPLYTKQHDHILVMWNIPYTRKIFVLEFFFNNKPHHVKSSVYVTMQYLCAEKIWCHIIVSNNTYLLVVNYLPLLCCHLLDTTCQMSLNQMSDATCRMVLRCCNFPHVTSQLLSDVTWQVLFVRCHLSAQDGRFGPPSW